MSEVVSNLGQQNKQYKLKLTDIDALLDTFREKEPGTLRLSLFEAIRSFYTSQAAISKLKTIPADTLIERIYPDFAKLSDHDKKTKSASYRKKFSSLKSALNEQCRQYYWQQEHPPMISGVPIRIGVGTNNILCFLKPTKEEKIRDLELQMQLIKNKMLDWGIDGQEASEIDAFQQIRKQMETEKPGKSKKAAEPEDHVAIQVTEEKPWFSDINFQTLDSSETVKLKKDHDDITKAEPVAELIETLQAQYLALKQDLADLEQKNQQQQVEIETLKQALAEKSELSENLTNADDLDKKIEAESPEVRKELEKLQTERRAMMLRHQQLLEKISKLSEQLNQVVEKNKKPPESPPQIVSSDQSGSSMFSGTGDGIAYLELWIPAADCVVTKFHREEPAGTEIRHMGDFFMDNHPITNRLFAQFVDATGYQTLAERRGYGWIFRPQGWVKSKTGAAAHEFRNRAYMQVSNCNWRIPHGNSLTYESLLDHPVVQVTLMDALAYAAWVNKKLPTVPQWEAAAATNGLKWQYPWSELPAGEIENPPQWCNTKESQLQLTTKIGNYPKNSYGLYEVSGNVWEICIPDDSENDTIYLKGGSWNSTIEFGQLRTTIRANRYRHDNVTGFRLMTRIALDQIRTDS